MTIIVLEGPDFAGKSTLAHSIRDNENRKNPSSNAVIIHNGQPPEGVNLFGHYVRQVQSAASLESLTVFDRLHVGESIYGPIYRGYEQLSGSQLRAIDEMLDDLGATKVFVDAADSDLLHRFRSGRGDDLVDDERTLVRIAGQYRTTIGGQYGTNAHGYLPGWITWTPLHTRVAGFFSG